MNFCKQFPVQEGIFLIWFLESALKDEYFNNVWVFKIKFLFLYDMSNFWKPYSYTCKITQQE